jgi:hypothetical protein
MGVLSATESTESTGWNLVIISDPQKGLHLLKGRFGALKPLGTATAAGLAEPTVNANGQVIKPVMQKLASRYHQGPTWWRRT